MKKKILKKIKNMIKIIIGTCQSVLINNNIQKNIQIINKSTLLNYSIQNHDMEQKYKKIYTFYFFM